MLVPSSFMILVRHILTIVLSLWEQLRTLVVSSSQKRIEKFAQNQKMNQTWIWGVEAAIYSFYWRFLTFSVWRLASVMDTIIKVRLGKNETFSSLFWSKNQFSSFHSIRFGSTVSGGWRNWRRALCRGQYWIIDFFWSILCILHVVNHFWDARVGLIWVLCLWMIF